MPGYITKQDDICIAGAGGLRICSLLDRAQFADPLGEAAALGIGSAAWPLFGQVWPSGLQLAAHMAARPLVPRQRILEVGCGLALASLVCHRRGADVTASDCHPLASSFLRRNARLNDLRPVRYRHGDWAVTESVDGGDTPLHRVPVNGRYGLIIGSDVLYERDETGQLARFIDRHALPSAEVLIVDPNRGNRNVFCRHMADAGFAQHDTPLRCALPDGRPYRGRLLCYRR